MELAPRKLTPCLWFDTEAEDAARFYISVFRNGRIDSITRYPQDVFGKKAGSVMTVEFEIEGQPFVGLNGGPQYKFTEAVSFQIFCADQNEVDHFWSKLTQGGEEGPCGWLKDKFGLSWQVVPTVLMEMLKDKNPAKGQRVSQAFMQMKKFDIDALHQAFAGR